MKRPFFLLIALIALAVANDWDHGRVVTVIDGDTVMLKKPTGQVVKCRLIGLDTFETKVNHRTFRQLETLKNLAPRETHSIKEVLHFGYWAKDYTTDRVLGKNVDYHGYGLDQYGRELIYIKNLNYSLIRNGIAVQYPTNLLSPERKAFLYEAGKKAHVEHRGLYDRGYDHGE